jgi:hypothetical protein
MSGISSLIVIPSFLEKPKYLGVNCTTPSDGLILRARNSIEEELAFLELNLSAGKEVFLSFFLSARNSALDAFKALVKSRNVESMTSSGTSRW